MRVMLVMATLGRCFGTSSLAILAGWGAPAGATPPCSDGFAEGYASARLELEFEPSMVLGARDGVLYLDSEESDPARRERAERALDGARCIDQIRWASPGSLPAAEEPAWEEPPDPDDPAAVNAAGESQHGFVLIPRSPLFEPLTADPRWPRFSASYLDVRDDPELGSVGSVAFGGSIPLFQADAPLEGRWEIGVQAGVFSIFDLDSDSYDLVNSDYWVGLPVSARWGGFSFTVRPYHQSSHLGDEYLLRDAPSASTSSTRPSTASSPTTSGAGAGCTGAGATCSAGIRTISAGSTCRPASSSPARGGC